MSSMAMSLLALLVWVVIPLFVILMAPVLWRRSKIPWHKNLVVAASVAVLSAPMLISNGVKWWYDRQVSELCAKDGGVKVYETVRLTSELLGKGGIKVYEKVHGTVRLTTNILDKVVSIWIPSKRDAKLEDEYYYESFPSQLISGNPEVYRSHEKVYRKLDYKLLGETISYGRIGGELPGPWHGSSYSCPSNTDITNLIKQIFIK